MKAVLCLMALALAACATGGKRGADARTAIYDLGSPVTVSAGGTLPLAVEVRAPAWLDTPAIAYRLAYAERERRREYAHARWAAPPPALVQQRLVQTLGLVPAGQGGAKCLLRLDIDEFSHVFAAPASSRGSLLARATLLDAGRRILAERRLAVAKAAPSQDSRGGVAALAAAVDEMGGELGRWRAEQEAGGRLKSCR